MHLLRLSDRLFKRLALIGLGLIVAGLLIYCWPTTIQPTLAQSVQYDQVAKRLYEQVPGLPLENTYVNSETGRVSTDNTLISRLIRYNIYAKSRPPNYRLDWKLTLADYLGVNERIESKTYPSGSSMRKNPMEGDIAAVNRLTLAQRMAVVDLLAASFTPQTAPPTAPSPTTSPAISPVPIPSPIPDSRFPRQPQPGDARLLQP